MILSLILFLLLCYLFKRLTCGITRSPTCLIGKTAIVTGGNRGLGYEICLNLASRGCRIIIADKDNSDKTREKIILLSGNSNIISKNLDLSSFKSIRNFAADISSNEDKVDILINNAGIGGCSTSSTEDGLNPIMQVNYFGPFLLTHLLLNALKKSTCARVIFTSSCLAFLGDLDLDTFTCSGEGSTLLTALKFYSKSKLATIIASDIFAQKLDKHGVTSNSLHPGIIGTPIWNTVEGKMSISTLLIHIFNYVYGKTAWEGAQTTIYLAVSQNVEKVTGKHFWDCRRFIKPPQTRNKELCKKIWQKSEDTVKLTEEEKI